MKPTLPQNDDTNKWEQNEQNIKEILTYQITSPADWWIEKVL